MIYNGLCVLTSEKNIYVTNNNGYSYIYFIKLNSSAYFDVNLLFTSYVILTKDYTNTEYSSVFINRIDYSEIYGIFGN